MRRSLQLTILALFVSILQLHSQEYRYLDINNGLSSNHIWSVQQDAKGFTWILSQLGVDRYDGSELVQYTTPENIHAKDGYGISYLKVFGGDEIYIYSVVTAKVYRYDETLDKFQLHCHLNPKQHWGASLIYDIISMGDETLYISSNIGILRFKDGEYTPIKLYEIATTENVFLCKSDDNTIIFKLASNLFSLDIRNNDIEHLVKLEHASRCKTLHYDPRNTTLWIGNTTELLTYNISTHKIENVTALNPKTPRSPVLAISSLPGNRIAIGYDGAGVRVMDIYNYKIKNTIKESRKINSDGLHGNGVYAISLDQDNNMWIGTFSGGITIYNDSFSPFGGVVYKKSEGEKLPNATVTSILNEDDDNIWFATNNGVAHWNIKSNTWRQYLNNEGGKEMVVLCLTKDKRGNIYAGTFTQGLYILRRGVGVVGHPTAVDETRNGDNIFSLYTDDNDQVWLGRFHRNMSVYNTRTKKFSTIPIKNAICVVRKSADEVYIGTSKGLYCANIHTHKIYRDENISSKTFINDIYNISPNTLCIATSGSGLLIYNNDTKLIQSYDISKGMPNNFIFACKSDNDGMIWATVEAGLVKIDPRDDTIEFYGKEDGLPTIGYVRRSMSKDNNKRIYVGTNEGFSWFEPQYVKHNKPKVKLYLKSFMLSNQVITPESAGSPIDKPIDKCEAITLNAGQNTFSINFTTLGFYDSQKIKFEWQLDGFDISWVTTSKERVINYTNVPAGDYILHLRALESSSNEVIAERKIEISVMPPIYQRWWAQLLMLLIILSIGYTIIKYYLMQISRRHSEEKIQFFANTAHDIRTPLALVNAPLLELNNEKGLSDRGKYYLNLANRNISKLNVLLVQLLDFQKSDNQKSQLVLSQTDIVNFVRTKAKYYSPLAAKRGLEYKISIDLDDNSINEWIDTTKMDRVLDNLITNALKYTPSGGKVTIKLVAESKYWSVIISDTGIGIPKSQHKKLFKEYYRGDNAIASKTSGVGLGLILVRNYVKLHNGEISFKSKEGIGSEFTLTLRRGRAHYPASASYMEEGANNTQQNNITNELFPDIEPMERMNIESSGGEKYKLLVAEDNDDLREYLRVALSDEYAVTIAEDGEKALNTAKEISPDCIVSDVKMPNMSGIELTKLLREDEEISHTPIILLTALTSKDSMLEGFDIGADDYMFKPFDIDILRRKIAAILRRREGVHQQFAESNSDEESEAIDMSCVKEREREFVNRVISVINAHMMDPDFSVGMLASEAAVSKSLLFKKLKFITNQSPVNFIKVIKFRHAMSLLKTGRYSITEVATMTGFNDPKYFSTSFKAFHGVSPSKVDIEPQSDANEE